MYDLQYNRNTFNPHLRKDWQHSARRETQEECHAVKLENCRKFKNEFGYPNDVQYRIVKVK